MTWNYRVFEHGTYYTIHEVYYEEDGTVLGYTEHTNPYGESPEELRQDLEMMLRAFEKPVLKYE